MHSEKNIFVLGPSNILFAGVYACTFQPGNFTGQAAVKGLTMPTGKYVLLSVHECEKHRCNPFSLHGETAV